MSNIGDKLYDDAANLGRFTSKLALGMFGAISLGIVGFAMWYFYQQRKLTKEMLCTVTRIVCMDSSNSENKDCLQKEITITYEYNGNSYTSTFSSIASNEFVEGGKYTIDIDPFDPNNYAVITAKTPTLLERVGLLLLLAVLISAIAYAGYYMTSRYKFAAAGMGVRQVL